MSAQLPTEQPFHGLRIKWSAALSLFNEGRLLDWFSCGIASACMLKLTTHLSPFPVYCDTSRDEHPDNARFMRDVEQWTGIKITVIGSNKFKTTAEVFDAKQYMSGPAGASCTGALKKAPRFEFANPDDVHCFGFTVDEKRRIENFERNNPDLNLAWPLVDAGMTKSDCLKMVADAGIEIPLMYRLGFANNNCIGCVKAQSPAYWNLTRKHFPERFMQRAEQSRRLGCRLVRLKGQRIFLDELPADTTETIAEDLSCGPQCGGAQ
jgi:hypothetical protein